MTLELQNPLESTERPLTKGWQWVTIGEMTSAIQYGSSAKTSEDATGVPVLRMGNIKEGSLVLDSLKFLPHEHQEFPDLLLRDGDLLFNRTNSAELVGKSAVYRSNPEKCSCASYLIRVRLKPDYVPEYVANYLNSPFGRQWISSVVSQQVGQANVNASKLKALKIPVPDYNEQCRIVAGIEKQFTRLDAGVTALRRVQANLNRYRAAVLKAACDGKLVPTEASFTSQREDQVGSLNLVPDYETGEQLLQRLLAERRRNWTRRGQYKEPVGPDAANLPHLPKGWAWATVEQLTSLVTSGSRGWGEFYSDAGPLFVRAQDIKTDSLNFLGIARVALPEKAEGMRSAVENGDLLITITGANVTKTAVVHGLEEVAFVSQHVALLKPVFRETSAFHFMWIVSPAHGRKQLEQWAYGAGKPGLSLEQIRSLPLAVPPVAEQIRIVAEVEQRLCVIDSIALTIASNLRACLQWPPKLELLVSGGHRTKDQSQEHPAGLFEA
ncbi:MAG TPA: restriction endonuclease subunit S [Verrucomicrobiales bacterium]|nr:restriction endonuclease subunit S [Verrucomicrobiales bacterium]